MLEECVVKKMKICGRQQPHTAVQAHTDTGKFVTFLILQNQYKTCSEMLELIHLRCMMVFKFQTTHCDFRILDNMALVLRMIASLMRNRRHHFKSSSNVLKMLLGTFEHYCNCDNQETRNASQESTHFSRVLVVTTVHIQVTSVLSEIIILI